MTISRDNGNTIRCQLSNLNKLIYTRTLKMLLILMVLFTGCDPQKDKDLERIRRVADTVTSPQYGFIWENKYDYICQYPLFKFRRIPISNWQYGLNYIDDTVKVDVDLLLFGDTDRYKQSVTFNFERGKDDFLWLASISQGSIQSASGFKELLPILGIFLLGVVCSFLGRTLLVSGMNAVGIIVAIIGMGSLFGIVPAFAFFYWKASYGTAILAIILGFILGGGLLIGFFITDAIKEGNKSNLIFILFLVVGIFYSLNEYSKADELLDKRSIVAMPNTDTSMGEFLSNVHPRLILRGFKMISKEELSSNKVLSLIMNRKGEMILDNEYIENANFLGQVLRQKIIENPELILSIRTDPATRPEHLVDIFDPIQFAGVAKIHLAN